MDLANVASLRWHAYSRVWGLRKRAWRVQPEGSSRVAYDSMARAYRVLWRHAARNRYGFRVDHTGQCLTWCPRPEVL